jgi:hypothetical protein
MLPARVLLLYAIVLVYLWLQDKNRFPGARQPEADASALCLSAPGRMSATVVIGACNSGCKGRQYRSYCNVSITSILS